MKILVTGCAGFIGFHLCQKLLEQGYQILGIDNINSYYDEKLKNDRLKELCKFKKFKFQKVDISHANQTQSLGNKETFDSIIHLAAQAGVRYSISNPSSYIDSNLVGFGNILELARRLKISHTIFASSSSVYGLNKKQPFDVSDYTDYPISLYAATKKSNELQAFSYSHLYDLPITGLRFFTVYGPWGRPDMAYFKFTKAILKGEKIDVYNHGKMERDFTYIDDVTESIEKLITLPPEKINNEQTNSNAKFKIYNVGNNRPEKLEKLIECIEKECQKKAKKNLMEMQSGDVLVTYADVEDLKEAVGFSPNTSLEIGIKNFVSWYRSYYKL